MAEFTQPNFLLLLLLLMKTKKKNLTEPPIWVDLGASFIHGCASWNPVYQIALALGVDVRTDFGGFVFFFLILFFGFSF